MPSAPHRETLPALMQTLLKMRVRLNQFLILLLAYFITGWLGLLVPFENENVTLFWLPSGIAAAAFYRWTPKLWPSVFIASFLINMTTDSDLLINLTLAASNILSPLATVWLLRRFNCDLSNLDRKNTLSFLLLSAFSMTATASITATFLGLYHSLSLETSLYLGLAWWMSDSLGAFLAMPLLVNITRDYLDQINARRMDFLLIAGVSLVVGLICFPLNNYDSGNHLPIVFITFICIAWAALWFGLFGGAFTAIGFCFLAIWSTVNHAGPFVLSSMPLSYWLIWLYAASMVIISLMITAAHLTITSTYQRLAQSDRHQAQQRLQLERAQLMARLAHWQWDPLTDDYQFSRSMTDLFGLPAESLSGKMETFIARFIHPNDRPLLRTALKATRNQNKALALDLQLEMGAQRYWLQLQTDQTLTQEDAPLQGTLQDISERKRLDMALTAAAADAASAPEFFVTILRALGDAINADHVLISLIDSNNPTTAHTHTYLRQGELQPNFSYSLDHTPCADVMDEHSCFFSTNVTANYPDDEMFRAHNIESYLGAGIRNAQGKPIGILIAMSERAIPVSAQLSSLLLIFAERIGGELRRAQDQEKIYNLAFFDSLTRLPNRRMLQDRLKLVISQSARSHQYGALLFIDIDHFKLLNDTRGHHIGDQLLVQVAERIDSVIRSSDLAARLGGDEFVVVFDNLSENPENAAQEAKKRAEELHKLISLPYSLRQSVHHCTISIGVSLFNNQTGSSDDLLRHADAAMYQAKDSGRNAIRFFDPSMQSHLEKRAVIEMDLRAAHESRQQFISYYQVQVDEHAKAIGVELLLRWLHPHKGMISPADFIPIAEQTGLIVAMGLDVIRDACAQLQRWQQRPEFAHLSIAVNVSPIQFNQANFVEEILAVVDSSQINPKLLKLELTESSLLKNVDQSITKMQQLQDRGIGFSMDDFGIGYSSLSYLKRLPLEQLKIDQTFVRDIAIDPNDAVIVRTIIAMAQNMNLQVIAEGVETAVQKEFLEQNGCRLFQGYFFGSPMPIKELETVLIERAYCT